MRQYGKSLEEIRKDHVNRYEFAVNRLYLESSVLDAACGCGYGSWMLFNDGKEVTGIDISEKAINFAKSHWRGPDYKLGDVLTVDIGHYDAVVSFETLEHIRDPKAVLQRFREATDGLLIASVPNESVYPFDAGRFQNDEYPHLRHYAPDEFQDLLESADFEVIERFCQKSKRGDVVEGTDGMFLIYVAR